ncbi:leucine-rich repeat protein kinase family protein [Striga asiatica]|uniref:Leucine-rich repeat protein kinase family protein n=1 Tax=Striga asiatica TaxID=4170 RepID=A0A5A7QS06_STRAF|nr:leucine-rich repeat protein kinase family protein [Striga asiatica]
MSAIYDNWERLVAAVTKKQQLLQLFHDSSRSPSVLSETSDFSSSFDSSPDQALDFSRSQSSSRPCQVSPKLVLFSDFIPAVDAEGPNPASTRFLGRGSFGAAYAVQMDRGPTIVLKRLRSTSFSDDEFERHMDVIGNVRHENVAPLRAYYSFQGERFLLYDYYSTGSVYQLLHDKWDFDTSSVLALKNGETGQAQSFVSWETRMKIAVGTARGVAEIHRKNGGKLVHGNITASNIFLNSQGYGFVSDLGVTEMIDTKFMPKARCYAPEIKNSTKNVSQASDVYSFGVLLLELLTRKASVHVRYGPTAVDLVKLVKSVKNRERASKVFDPGLLKHRALEEQMVKVLQIGIKCVEKSIKMRPKMSQVVKMLEKINVVELASRAHLTEKLVFIEDRNATFDLEDILSAPAEMLGRGIFGICYKTLLNNGEAVVVKRLRDVMVSFEVFEEHLEIIRRMRHNNVGKLKAYFYTKGEKLLVYDYYKKESNDRTTLDLETRLKIVLGAARGLEYIHRQDGGMLVHGNVKSSNIFLNTQKYGLVSDVGLWKLTETRTVSQSSDVYNFGVVVLECLCKKPSQFATESGQAMSLVDWARLIIRKERRTDLFDPVLMLMGEKEEETMVKVLQMAMACVDFTPEHRPRMSRVVRILEEIGGFEPYEEPSVESRLEDLMESLMPTFR